VNGSIIYLKLALKNILTMGVEIHTGWVGDDDDGGYDYAPGA
jgi:hypothetical protein